jgi:transposase
LATKLSVICDQDQIPVSACFYPANVTDVTTTIQSVNEVECNVRKDGRYSNVLVGDKGCISTAVKEALRQRRIYDTPEEMLEKKRLNMVFTLR